MFRNLFRQTSGSVNILAAFAIPLVIGLLGFAIEAGNGYSVKVRNQSIADSAALAAAQSYSNQSSVSEMLATARSIASASEISPDDVTATLVSAPDGSGDEVVQVDIVTTVPYFFARVISSGSQFEVAASALASFGGGNPACIVALRTGDDDAISVTGGSDILANDCDVTSNGGVEVRGGSSILAPSVNAGESIEVQGGSSITADSLKENQGVLSDPLADNSEIAAALTELDQISNFTTVEVPSVPAVSGATNFAPAYNPSDPAQNTHSGLTGSYDSSNRIWTFPRGTYDINNLQVAGGQQVIFEGGSVLNINGNITSTGSGLTIGNGGDDIELNIRGDINVSGGSRLNIGDGTIRMLGRLNATSNTTIGDGRHYFGQIDSGAALIVGDGDTDINGKLAVGGGHSATFGDGAFAISTGFGTDAITANGAARLEFGDGPFAVNGNITLGGSSTIIFGATQSHYINGDLTLRGNATFGAGTYFINGDLINATTGTMTGIGVSFVLDGQFLMGGSAQLDIRAPTESSTTAGGIVDIVVITLTEEDTVVEAGSNSTLNGIIYVPNSELEIRSGGELNGGGGCWSIVADTVEVVGGALANTETCSPLEEASGSGGNVRLIQ